MRPAILVLATLPWLACGGAAPSGAAGDAPQPAGAAAGPASAAPATLERLDDGGDCAGLVPAQAPAPVTVHRAVAPGATCLGGTSEGGGAVAVGAREASGATTWQVYAPDGSPRGVFAADAPILPAPSGWQAIVSSGAPGAYEAAAALVTFAPDGGIGRSVTVSPDPALAAYARWNAGRDPAGGAIVAVRSSLLAGNHWSPVTAQRCDAAGAPRWPAAVRVRVVASASEPLFLAGGVSTAGEALVVSQHSSSLDVSWLDAGGAVIAGASADAAEPAGGVVGGGLAPALELFPLLDGALAVRADGTFRRVYPRRATVTSPLPAWLAERAASTLRATRGATGYAALPPPGQAAADCTQRIDVLSPSGRLCGRVVLREDAAGCTTGVVDQGWDGTVVQQSGKDPCTHRFWPRLLGR